jgi:hypothetical protein
MEEKKTKAERVRANQEAAGIPDSKPFASPSSEPTGVDRMLNSHINGVLVRDLNLEPQVIVALSWHATDEGIAEANARPMVRENSGIEMGKGPWEHALDQRRDDVRERGMETFEARDPFKEIADRYAVPGMRPKFMRDRKDGVTGDHQVVKDQKGDPVKVKGMVLAHIPEEKAQARARHYRERGNQFLKQIGEEYKKTGGKTAVVDLPEAA